MADLKASVETPAGKVAPGKTLNFLLRHGDPEAKGLRGEQLYPPRKVRGKLVAFQPYEGSDEVRYEIHGVETYTEFVSDTDHRPNQKRDVVMGVSPENILEAEG